MCVFVCGREEGLCARGKQHFIVVRNADSGFKSLLSHSLAIWPQVHYVGSWLVPVFDIC